MYRQSNFGNTHNSMRKFVITFIAIVFTLIIAGYVVIGYLGVKTYNEVQDNNGSIGTTIGSMYKDFKEASNTEGQ